ncbi:MAG: hypothetical protein CME64_18245 [Halobacteriovoraceae bacterium]|nr:hypothetical protein [Halobacteriovoraceae bacterium]
MLNKLKSGPWPIFILSSFSSIANLYLPIFLARTMSPEQMGVYKIFFLYLGAIPFLFLAGGPLNSVYYWVGRSSKERTQYLQQCFFLILALSLGILMLGLPFTERIAIFTNLTGDNIYYLLFGAFVAVPSSFYSETKVALGHTIKGSLFDTSFEVLKVVVFIAVALQTKDVQNIFIAFCAIFTVKFSISTGLKIKSGHVAFLPQKKKLKEIWFYCLPISLSGLVTFGMDKIDQFVLSAHLGTEEFAFYSMGCLIVPPLYLIEMSVSRVLIPKLSSTKPNEENLKINHFKSAITDISIIIIPAFFGLWIFSDQIVEFLYTDKFIDSAKYLKVFAVSYLFLMMPYDAIPRATGKTKFIFHLALIFGVLSVIAVTGAALHLSALQVLMISLIFKFLSRFAGLVYSSKIMGWRLRSMIPWINLTKITAVCCALYILCEVARPFFKENLQWFYFCAPAFALLYFIVLAKDYKRRN